MNSLRSMTILAMAFLFQQSALASCDGIPVKDEDSERVCMAFKEKQSCERILGCTWTYDSRERSWNL